MPSKLIRSCATRQRGCATVPFGPCKLKWSFTRRKKAGSAEVPALPGCVSQGESMDELLANVREVIQAWLATEVPS